MMTEANIEMEEVEERLSKDDIEEIKKHIDDLENDVDQVTLEITSTPKLNPLEVEHRLSHLETKMNILLAVFSTSIPVLITAMKIIVG